MPPQTWLSPTPAAVEALRKHHSPTDTQTPRSRDAIGRDNMTPEPWQRPERVA